jgi:hypothetical protein
MRSGGNFSPEWGYLAPAPSFLRTARIVVVATAVGATAGAGVVLSLIEHPTPEVSTTAAAAHAIVTSAQAAPAPVAASIATKEVVTPAKPPAQVQASAQPMAPVQPAPVVAARPTQIPASPNPVTQNPVTQSVVTQVPAPPAPAAPAPVVAVQPVSPDVAPAVTSTPGVPLAAPSVAALTEGSPATDMTPAQTPDETAVAPADVTPQKKPSKHNGANQANAKNKQPPGLGGVLRHLFDAHSGASYYPSR